ncbi:MAG: ACP S-malonyltransferase [Deltaproteobacteria bacterium]|nr:ACP S-malonyltransferase [Deltaproteobacteria bacterium]
MAERIAFLFPGQGSQVVGMGLDLALQMEQARELFDLLDEICLKPLSRLCFQGPMEELTLTVNLQPAVTAVNLACLRALNRSQVRPTVCAGHSVGECAALVSAGVLSERDALLLAKKRGELMHREAILNPGSMAAVMGLRKEEVEEVVRLAAEEGVIGIANYNTAQQIVITGQQESLRLAMDLIKQKGGKAIPLNVSGAWHSPLMRDGVKDFRDFMEEISFSEPRVPMLFNAEAEAETDPGRIKEVMAQQLTRPVRWNEIMLRMLDQGVDAFVEVGPKNVLIGLLKKTLPRESNVALFNVGDMKGLKSLLDALS